MRNATLEDVVEIFEEIIDLSDVQIDESAVLGEDIPVDSREMLSILSRIESRYEFKFEPLEVLSLKNIGDVINAINRRREKL